MKHFVAWFIVILVSGCASLRTARDEAAAVGTFKMMLIGGTHYLDLRADHRCVIWSSSAFAEAPRIEATWRFDEGVVTISPTDSPPFSLTLGRRRFEVVLSSSDGRRVYIRQPKKEPNKAPEPTPRPVTIPAEPGIAPGRVAAHL